MDKRQQKKWKRKLRPVESSRPALEPKGAKGIEFAISNTPWARQSMIQSARNRKLTRAPRVTSK